MAVDIYYRCFVFSREQYDQKASVARKMGKIYKSGRVLVNGIPKPYTDLLTSFSNAKFADSIEVISGDIRKLRYEAPESVSTGGK